MLPSKKFLFNAIAILLVAVVWFGVSEYRNSKVIYDSSLLQTNTEEVADDYEITDEEVTKMIDSTIAELDREDALNVRRYGAGPQSGTEEADIKDLPSPSLRPSDFITTSSATPVDTRLFGSQLGTIIFQALNNNGKDEIVSITDFLTTGDLTEIEHLTKREEQYAKAAFEITELTVPVSALIITNNIANLFLDMAEALKDMKNLYATPQDSAVATRYFQLRRNSLSEEIARLNKYFTNQDIYFNASDQLNIKFVE
ncbi:MAG: hypothetical protein Q8Q18_02225 [bacterium]|nr:hypothetical protein [bacterium]